MILKQTKKLILATIVGIFTTYLFTSSSPAIKASSSGTDGFIIEAQEITGTLGVPLIVFGETATRKAVPMIDLAMDNLEIKGLVIKKVTQTPNGPVTTVIKSGGLTKLKKMRVRITNIELGGLFIPKLGYLGMKDVKLLAYKQTADIADLPNFSVHYESGNANQMKDQNEEGLNQIIKSLQNGGKEKEEETPSDEDKKTEEDIEEETATEPALPEENPEKDPADQEEPADDTEKETPDEPETDTPDEPGNEEDETEPEDPADSELPPEQEDNGNGDAAPKTPNPVTNQ